MSCLITIVKCALTGTSAPGGEGMEVNFFLWAKTLF